MMDYLFLFSLGGGALTILYLLFDIIRKFVKAPHIHFEFKENQTPKENAEVFLYLVKSGYIKKHVSVNSSPSHNDEQFLLRYMTNVDSNKIHGIKSLKGEMEQYV